jgi:hypothetical protein
MSSDNTDASINHFRRDFFFAFTWGFGGIASIRFMTSRASREASSGGR